MRHQVSGRRLNRTPSHRNAMMRNMVTSLIMHERISTTVQKAKELRIVAEKLVTLAKRGDLHARRQALKVIRSIEAMKKLFDDYSNRFATRNGGYTRITRTGFRHGDKAEMSIIEFLPAEQKKVVEKGKKTRRRKAAKKDDVAKPVTRRKTAAKKEETAPEVEAVSAPADTAEAKEPQANGADNAAAEVKESATETKEENVEAAAKEEPKEETKE